MEIKYSKFEISNWDIIFLILFLFDLLVGIEIFFNEKEFAGIIFLIVGVSYFVYRFFLVMIVKNKIKIIFSDYEVRIKGLFFEKIIEYSDMKKLIVRKNILGSYDILVNFDSSIGIYKYICNFIKDVSIESNHKKSYIFCDIRNKDEILEYLLRKIGYPKKEIREKTEIEKLYVKYSIFERFFMLCFGIFGLMAIFSIGIMLEYKTMVFFKVIFLLLIITVIRFFKKDYSMKRYNSYKILISEKKKEIYVMEDFYETDEKLIINYGNTNFYEVKFNYYYFQNNVMPRNYRKIKI